MTISRRFSRKMTLDNEVYRVYLRRNRLDKGWAHVAIQHATCPGRILLIDPFTLEFMMRPRFIADAMRYALAHGWNPCTPGEPFIVCLVEGEWRLLPGGKQFLLAKH